MRDVSSVDLSGLGSEVERFKRWKPDAQAKALDMLKTAEQADWKPFYCRNRECNGQPHVWPADERECPWRYGHEWVVARDGWACKHCHVGGTLLDDWAWTHARIDQRPPRWKDNWLTLFMRGGRGSGKTRTGSEITRQVTKTVRRITLIGSTGPDFRSTMVEGDSGILATSPPGERPLWEPSKKRLTWPNGCIAEGYSAEEPDRLRGQNSGYVWADEPAHWPLVEECWSNMLFGLRKGEYPKIVATSTPKPTVWVKAQLADALTVDRRVASYANLSNLSPVYRHTVIEKFEGSRTGRQELEGEVLEDVEGALWNMDMVVYVEEHPRLKRIVVSVDPAGTANKKSDETGIVVVGIGEDKNLYVLADATGKYSPEAWAAKANALYDEYSADAIVAEKNYGGDMVRTVLENSGYKGARIILVTSRRGKDLRAEPVVALYEKHRVFHVGIRGSLETLDDEMTTWVPHESASPNRVDALVHGITELAKNVMPTQIASPSDVLRGRQSSTQGRTAGPVVRPSGLLIPGRAGFRLPNPLG